MQPERYILDPLYGVLHPDGSVWDLLCTPEIQRLREVRLSNVNSPTLTGAGSVNRFEHSVGTAHLGNECASRANLRGDDARLLVLACLLHDVGSAAFGHSVQYILDRSGYSHESLFDLLVGSPDTESGFRYQHATLEAIYFGVPRTLSSLLPERDLRAISDTVAGNGRLGPLVNGTMDLDNIDNVFRLAFHMGLSDPGNTPEELARAMAIDDGQLVIRDDAIPLVECWYDTRRALYAYLLENPDEFAAKCMLEEATIDVARRSAVEIKWQDVDFRVVEKLSEATAEAKDLVTRLMLGDVYGCISIVSTSATAVFEEIRQGDRRGALEWALSEQIRRNRPSLKSSSVALHFVKDVGRTSRRVDFVTTSGEQRAVGESSRRVLIGVFLRNKAFSAQRFSRERMLEWGVPAMVGSLLARELNLDDLTEMVPYAESS